MSHRNRTTQQGFTLIELMISIVVIGVLSTAAYTFFLTSMNQYLAIQQDGIVFGDLARQSQRVSNVLRGLTGIVSASSNDLTVYAYFAPNDTYVSKIRYYKSADGKKLLADLTKMTANPPIGTEVVGSTKTVTIMDSYATVSGVPLFTYLNSAGAVIATPIADLQAIKGIKTTLAVPSTSPVKNSNTTVSSQVSLRNRKNNL